MDDFEDVTDNYFPIITYAIVAACAFALLSKLEIVSNNILDIIGFLLVTIGLAFQLFRPRYCTKCGTKMKKYFNGPLSVPYHYCGSCKIKTNTFVRSRTT